MFHVCGQLSFAFKNHLLEDYLLTWENVHNMLKEKSKIQNYISTNFSLNYLQIMHLKKMKRKHIKMLTGMISEW